MQQGQPNVHSDEARRGGQKAILILFGAHMRASWLMAQTLYGENQALSWAPISTNRLV